MARKKNPLDQTKRGMQQLQKYRKEAEKLVDKAEKAGIDARITERFREDFGITKPPRPNDKTWDSSPAISLCFVITATVSHSGAARLIPPGYRTHWSLGHLGDDFLKRFHLADSFHPEPLKITR